MYNYPLFLNLKEKNIYIYKYRIGEVSGCENVESQMCSEISSYHWVPHPWVPKIMTKANDNQADGIQFLLFFQ